ncbi:hypothetical protein SUGI_0582160 [Cryptomeria japonica]|uniref:profilin-5 n=1 Tax=Cryptomeria japonica TaxID=3369 RepID=UPI002414CFA6|nr:profilin-5 [Cryptomeria japonica]GLJ29530.1 hypothetical protein SUGI_0582160 [Cryptomeria japonica]
MLRSATGSPSPVQAMTSWQDFVEKQLMVELSNGSRLSSAAIVGQDGLLWARSHTFPPVIPEEIVKIMKGFEDSGEMGEFGIHVGGIKYIFIQGDPGQVIRGRKVHGGITIKKTRRALVMGIYEEPVAPSECNMVVEKLGDYLIEQGI